jgi:rhodanese-related sulfurtransferase
MRKWFFLTAVLLLIPAWLCGQRADSTKYTVLPAKQFFEKYSASAGAALIDARGPGDYRKSRIKGAENIVWPLPESYFSSAAAPDSNKPVFVYCYVGNRSKKAAVVYYDHGYHEVYSLKGGFSGWKGAKMPVDRKRHRK